MSKGLGLGPEREVQASGPDGQVVVAEAREKPEEREGMEGAGRLWEASRGSLRAKA